MFRVDLHTHSIISYDGGITAKQYAEIFSNKNCVVAITDHNEIAFAKDLHVEFADQVIIGEEISTFDGEIIGLFLETKIDPGLTLKETISQIRAQGGLVYVPHPLEVTRKGLSLESLEKISGSTNIIEVFNARLREPWLLRRVEKFAKNNNIASASSSDAHGLRGFGTSYSRVLERPNSENLINLLKDSELVKKRAPLLSFLHPTRNKLRKKFNLLR